MVCKQHKVLLFKLIAISIPFVVIFLLEISLRLFHYGYDLSLFVEHSNSEYFVVNPHASKRYFVDPAFAPTGNYELFKKKKAPNTLRFFVLGESTTVGFPYFHNGSFHRWLLYRLMHEYPGSTFEIINLSLTAVNSYTVLGYAKEIVEYEPDAVLIYSGQNEYYGGLGVASSQSIGGSPAIVNMLLSIRDFRIVQLLLNLTQSTTKKNVQPTQTRMELMVGNQKIPYQSDLYEKGIKQFQYNMDLTLRILSNHNIPVFLSNLVSNVKDLPPFIGNDEANGTFRTGQELWKEGNYAEAGRYFTQAKELDELRFRAPEALNDIIEELCGQYPRSYFVDTQSELKKHTPHQVLGDELFIDHVHPSLKGYGLMANAFYNTMQKASFLGAPEVKISEEQLFQEMPVSPIDSIAAEFRIWQLRSHWPYNDQSYNKAIPEGTTEEKLAARFFRREIDWLSAHNTLYNEYVRLGRLDKATKVAEGLVLEYSEDPVSYDNVSMIYGELGNIEQAAFYMKRSFDLEASFEKAHYLFVFYLKMDKPEQALPYFNYAVSNNSSSLNLKEIEPLISYIIMQKKKLSNMPQDVPTMNDIALTYMKMGNADGTIKYIDAVLQIDPKNQAALELKEQLK